MSLLPVLASALAIMQSAPMTDAGKAVLAEEQDRLSRCIETIETDPEAAYEDALAWLGNGGRPAARHCAALALIELGYPDEGAARLEDLANAPDGGDIETRAVYLAKAGNAWLVAGYPEAAITTLDNALKLRPGDRDLLIDRAAARLAIEQWDAAVGDLNEILVIAPGDPGALELRARALLELGRYTSALSDVSVARVTAPENIDLLVLRGEIREAQRLDGR
ncbi:MAG: hypothetical protein AAF216_10495 [Pseudomonadota bacterium]